MKGVSILLPLLLVAGCGGGDGGSTRSAYVAQAEAVCKDAITQIDALKRPTDPASFQAVVEKGVQIAESATDKLKALEPPSGDKAEVEQKVIDPLERKVAEGKAYLAKVTQAVKKNDQLALGQLLQNPPTVAQADLVAMRSFGLTQCAKAAEKGG